MYGITNTSKQDLEFIYHLFDEAIAYQKRKKYDVWKGYDADVLKRDMDNGLQYKIEFNNEILFVFSISFTNPIVWRDMENGDALYIHLMVVNPNYKGQQLFSIVLKWAFQESKKKHFKFIRLETWANNANMIAYYENFGFVIVDRYITPNCEDLPIPHRNLDTVLMQNKI